MSLLHAVPRPAPREKKPRKALRRTWMKAPHSKFCSCSKCERKRKRRGADPAYLDVVRSLPCACISARCSGPIHAHHAIHRSQGGRDADAVPLCMIHHKDWHEGTGPFLFLSRLERFAWAMLRIAETQAAAADRERRC